MPVRHKPGSKPYRDQLRASLSAIGTQGPQLTTYLESSHVPARPPAEAARPHQPRPRRSREDVIADVADESLLPLLLETRRLPDHVTARLRGHTLRACWPRGGRRRLLP